MCRAYHQYLLVKGKPRPSSLFEAALSEPSGSAAKPAKPPKHASGGFKPLSAASPVSSSRVSDEANGSSPPHERGKQRGQRGGQRGGLVATARPQ